MKRNTKTELLEQINILRMKMIQAGLEKGLNSYETINLSNQLDNLLFTYQLHNFPEAKSPRNYIRV